MSVQNSPDAEKALHLEQLMNQYGDSLLRICYLYLKDAGMAQDAVQDTFVKAWQKMDTFQGRSSEKTWLCHIAIQPVDPIARQVYDDVKALPEKYRVCVLLYYWQQMTLEDIAKVLSLSKSAVHHRLEKARGMLKMEMERSEMEWANM